MSSDISPAETTTPSVVPGSTLSNIVNAIFNDYITSEQHQSQERILVALVGIPAAGKTTCAQILCTLVNQAIRERASQSQATTSDYDYTQENEGKSPRPSQDASDGDPICVVVPMDGYHMTRAELAASDNPAEMFARRGAPWTFDTPALARALQRVKSNFGEEVRLNGWDHALKDPSYDLIRVAPSTRIVIVEGLYLLLEMQPWKELILPLFSRRILLECDQDLADERGIYRNWKAGICDTLEASRQRWGANDRLNAQLIMEHLDSSKLDARLTQDDFTTWIQATK